MPPYIVCTSQETMSIFQYQAPTTRREMWMMMTMMRLRWVGTVADSWDGAFGLTCHSSFTRLSCLVATGCIIATVCFGCAWSACLHSFKKFPCNLMINLIYFPFFCIHSKEFPPVLGEEPDPSLGKHHYRGVPCRQFKKEGRYFIEAQNSKGKWIPLTRGHRKPVSALAYAGMLNTQRMWLQLLWTKRLGVL